MDFPRLPFLIFFNHMKFQIVKINLLDEIVLIKPRFIMPFKFFDGGIQPDWFAKIEDIAHFFQSTEYFVGSGVDRGVLYDGIGNHSVVFKDFSPDSKHA